jgi:negative regulator of flagellin synthesis FlgM
MKISNNDELNKYINETAINRSKELSNKTPVPREDASSGTKEGTVVSLSPRAKEVQLAKKAMESEPDVRRDKVQEIKDKIKGGTYEIDFEKTAEKVVSAFFGKMM